jgi:N6-L-threonylcarbamoyladenine synthase
VYKRKLILAIESSCDETSIAILKQNQTLGSSQSYFQYINSFEVLSNVISSQIEIHKEYGGVIPELGAREHAKNIHEVFNSALSQANFCKGDLFNNLLEIKVTTNPGLVSALRVGLEFAKTIQFYCQKSFDFKPEIKEINHLYGHLSSSFFQSLKSLSNQKYSDKEVFSHLHLLVSGGNSQIILMNSPENKKIVGQTLDDAAGETFDKIGRMLGLPYPAGISIAKIAGVQNQNYFNFPIGMSKNKQLNYSFSGLKTAVRYFIEKQSFENWKFEQKLSPEEIEALLIDNNLPDYLDFIKKVCISVQSVITLQLTKKISLAIKEFQPKSLGLSGGVSANQLLRNELQKVSKLTLFLPDKSLTGDNAVMIGLV